MKVSRNFLNKPHRIHGANILKGGAIFLGISPPFERGRISWRGRKSCDSGIGKYQYLFRNSILPSPPPQIWVCPSNAQSPKILRPGAATGPCHTNVVFSVIRVVCCDCDLFKNYILPSPSPQIWICPSNAQSPKILRPGAATGPCHTNVVFSVIRVVRCCQFPYSVIGCS